MPFPMVLNVLNVLKVNYIQIEVVLVHKEHFLMEKNVNIKVSINVSAFQTQIGMEVIVFVKVDTVQMELHAIVKVLLWEIIVKDVLLNLTLFTKMVIVNVTMDMFNFVGLVF